MGQKKLKKYLNRLVMKEPVQWENFSGLAKKFFEQFDRKFGIRGLYRVRVKNADIIIGKTFRIEPVLEGYLMELSESLIEPKLALNDRVFLVQDLGHNWSWVIFFTVKMSDEETGEILYFIWRRYMYFDRYSNSFEWTNK